MSKNINDYRKKYQGNFSHLNFSIFYYIDKEENLEETDLYISEEKTCKILNKLKKQ
jgi:hypothetical protein